MEGDEPSDGKEWPSTFNTACCICRVTLLSTNDDIRPMRYRAAWTGPGIKVVKNVGKEIEFRGKGCKAVHCVLKWFVKEE